MVLDSLEVPWDWRSWSVLEVLEVVLGVLEVLEVVLGDLEVVLGVLEVVLGVLEVVLEGWRWSGLPGHVLGVLFL